MQGIAMLLLALLPACGSAVAGLKVMTGPERLPSVGTARVAAVTDGGTVILDDGRTVRLAGIEAPMLPWKGADFPAWPLADSARTVLEGLVLNRMVTLRGGTGADRHGRVQTHLSRDDGLWIEGEMLRQGLARTHSTPDDRVLAGAMLAIEAEARAARHGIWSDRFYAVRTPDTAGRDRDSFQLVEGRVVQAELVRGQVFLNFGLDWRSDFTIRISGPAARLFAREAAPLSLSGATVRVRGWVHEANGPMIEATHPEQIEIITPANPPPGEPSGEPLPGHGSRRRR